VEGVCGDPAGGLAPAAAGAVVRVFRCRPRPGAGPALRERLAAESVALVEGREGYGGCLGVGPGIDGDFWFITIWRDMSSVRAFAGDSTASVLPAGYAELLEDHSVEHRELVAWDSPASR
jgi:hypothetical protein